jgi:hypothetical protein
VHRYDGDGETLPLPIAKNPTKIKERFQISLQIA